MNISENAVGLPVWDCSIIKFDGNDLLIAGGTDGPISHENARIFLEFTNVAYIECPVEFSQPKIRLASMREIEKLNKRESIDERKVFAIEAETMGAAAPQVFYIIAESVSVSER